MLAFVSFVNQCLELLKAHSCWAVSLSFNTHTGCHILCLRRLVTDSVTTRSCFGTSACRNPKAAQIFISSGTTHSACSHLFNVLSGYWVTAVRTWYELFLTFLVFSTSPEPRTLPSRHRLRIGTNELPTATLTVHPRCEMLMRPWSLQHFHRSRDTSSESITDAILPERSTLALALVARAFLKKPLPRLHIPPISPLLLFYLSI